MSTITVILEPEATSSLRLRLPPEPRDAPVKIIATRKAVSALGARTRFGSLTGRIQLALVLDQPMATLNGLNDGHQVSRRIPMQVRP